jgi:CMP-N-acetylneuraminic acid synthetase
MNAVGIIPARSGSKRLVGKNVADLCGRPLIAHTCEAALRSGVLGAVYVNTDCPQIAAAAQAAGVGCPQLRPAELAEDETPTRDSNRFLIDVLAQRGERYDTVVVLQPTSPLRSAADIQAAWQLYEENAPCAVVSVSPVAPAGWLGTLGKDARFEPLAGNGTICRLNGAIYGYSLAEYLSEHEPARTLAHAMPASRGIDIDTEEDLRHAEFVMQCAAAGAS